ncbi:hypothetical protein TEQG_07155 [Trichophyton equinum CBS 127.97]|uniref:CHCH domain-containing protein n=2 Tax=Trichophyton TaxID=5550 RepID=F2Q259_TRIEC|nr:hypothetical protein TEQG_07155 [Trichophyton equinum CBS 127.97]
MSGTEKRPQTVQVDDDEPDDWYLSSASLFSSLFVCLRDKRIFSTGCADEQLKMNDCYYAKRDWRACSKEMQAFRECWKRHGNDQRTETRDA